MDYKLAIIGGMSVTLAGVITNLPSVRSVLKTPALRVLGAGLIAGGLCCLGAYLFHPF